MDVSNIIKLLGGGITFLQMIGGGIAFFTVCWGGVQIATAGFRYQQAEKGKETILYAVLGLAILLVGGTIIKMVLSTMGAGSIPIPTGVGGN